MYVYVQKYSTAQRYLDTHTRLVSLEPKCDICSTHYKHAGTRWEFSCIKQNLPVCNMCMCILKLPTLAVRYQAYTYVICMCE